MALFRTNGHSLLCFVSYAYILRISTSFSIVAHLIVFHTYVLKNWNVDFKSRTFDRFSYSHRALKIRMALFRTNGHSLLCFISYAYILRISKSFSIVAHLIVFHTYVLKNWNIVFKSRTFDPFSHSHRTLKKIDRFILNIVISRTCIHSKCFIYFNTSWRIRTLATFPHKWTCFISHILQIETSWNCPKSSMVLLGYDY